MTVRTLIESRLARRAITLVAAALMVVGALIMQSAPASAASPTGSCRYNGHHKIGYKEYNCRFYTTTPVVNHAGHKIGTLHAGTNWVLCQQQGKTVHKGKSYNNWWAYTLSDNHKYGWVNAVYGKGGSNNGKFANVPLCYNEGYPPKHGYAPGVRTTCFNHGGNTFTKPRLTCAGPSGNGWACIGNKFINGTPNYYREYGYYGPDCYINY